MLHKIFVFSLGSFLLTLEVQGKHFPQKKGHCKFEKKAKVAPKKKIVKNKKKNGLFVKKREKQHMWKFPQGFDKKQKRFPGGILGFNKKTNNGLSGAFLSQGFLNTSENSENIAENMWQNKSFQGFQGESLLSPPQQETPKTPSLENNTGIFLGQNKEKKNKTPLPLPKFSKIFKKTMEKKKSKTKKKHLLHLYPQMLKQGHIFGQKAHGKSKKNTLKSRKLKTTTEGVTPSQVPSVGQAPLIYLENYNLDIVTGANGCGALNAILTLFAAHPDTFFRKDPFPPKPIKEATEDPADFNIRVQEYLDIIKDPNVIAAHEYYLQNITYYCQNIYICHYLSTSKIVEYSFLLRSIVFALMDFIFPPGEWVAPPPEALVDVLIQTFFFSDLSNGLPSLDRFNTKDLWNGNLTYSTIYAMSIVIYRFLYLTISEHYLYNFGNAFRNTAADLRISGTPLAKILSKERNGKSIAYPIVPTTFQKNSGLGLSIVTENEPLPVSVL